MSALSDTRLATRNWLLPPFTAGIAALLWYVAATWFGANASGSAAAVAAMACWFGVLGSKALGWLVSRLRGAGEFDVTIQATLGMLVRMAFPMLVCVFAAFRGGALAEGGVVYAILVVYPASLAVETFGLLSGLGKPVNA